MNSQRTIQAVPYTEVAMHTRCAGRPATLVEETHYANGEEIPPEKRSGCYVIPFDRPGERIPMLKVEAGWYNR